MTTNEKPLQVPQRLRRGDLVGVVAASGPIDSELLRKGIAFFEDNGMKIRLGNYVGERNGYLAGDDEQRRADLNSMLGDRSVRAILFARGGYGVMRLLDSLDHEAVIRDPKPLLGMSDVTALQLSLFNQHGLTTFSGPMVAGQVANGLDPRSGESLIQALTEPLEGRDLFASSTDTLRVLRPGNARGHLLGGCLAMVTAILGTSHSPDYRSAILMLEDVNEPLYRIDRMITQLKLAGVLGRVAAIIIGHFVADGLPGLQEETEKLVLELTEDCPVPVVAGYPHGHMLPNLTVPHGVPVALDTAVPSLTVTTGPP